MFFATFDIEGNPTGFYNKDVHGENIPQDAISITEEQWSIFNNFPCQYIMSKQGIVEKPILEMSLEDTIKNKISRLSSIRYEKEIGGLDIDGLFFATDRESVSILNSALTSIQNGFATEIEWKTSTGSFVKLTKEMLYDISKKIFEHIQNCFKVESMHIDNINLLTTKKDVESYDIESGW